MFPTSKQILIPLIVITFTGMLVGGSIWFIQKETAIGLAHKKIIKEITSAQDGLIFTARPIEGAERGEAGLFRYFPSVGREVETLERLEEVAAKGPVSLSIISAKPNTDGVIINLEARGTFAALDHYLRLLEQMDLYLIFEQISLRHVSSREPSKIEPWLMEAAINIPILKK